MQAVVVVVVQPMEAQLMELAVQVVAAMVHIFLQRQRFLELLIQVAVAAVAVMTMPFLLVEMAVLVL
jgi:hypothetical protein